MTPVQQKWFDRFVGFVAAVVLISLWFHFVPEHTEVYKVGYNQGVIDTVKEMEK